MEPFHSRGDHFTKWKKKKNKKVDEVKLKTESKTESETNSVTNGHLIQRREGFTNQVNVLDSRLLQNVKKSSIQNTLLGKLRPTKMLEAEIYSSALSWNSDGSLLMAGGDRTLRIWTYPEGNLIHTLSTGLHSKGIHSAKFIKEYPQRVVSGTQKVQLWDINSNVEFASFNCHNNQVAGVLVVEGSPDVIWSAGIEGNVRAHDLREVCECEQGTQQGSQQGSQCKEVIISNNYLTSLGAKPLSFSRINSFDINPTRPYSILVGGEDSFARLFDTRNSQAVQYFCPKHLSTLGVKCKKINHVAFSSDGSEALINYQRENLYLINMKQETLKNLVNKEYGAKVYEPEEYGVEEVEELLKSMNELKVSDSDSNESVYEHVSPRGSERGSSEMSEEKSERGSSEMSEKDSERGCNEMSEEDSDLYLKDVVDKAFDTRQRFVGHLNLDYLTQEAKFIGREGEYIACGSADGMLYIYHKRTGKLMHRLFGNTYGVFCVQSHPSELAIATTGFGIKAPGIGEVNPTAYIEELVKIWTPDSVASKVLTENDLESIEKNKKLSRRLHMADHLPQPIRDKFDFNRLLWF